MPTKTRVYVPATFEMLDQLSKQGAVHARNGWAFSVTPALEEYFTSGDEEEIAYSAFQEAALASIRLLAIGDETFPHRRVVISADVNSSAVHPDPEMGEAVVKLDPAEITPDMLAAIHVDIEESEAATQKAIEAIDTADLADEDAELIVGDALDNFMAFYHPDELPFIVELL